MVNHDWLLSWVLVLFYAHLSLEFHKAKITHVVLVARNRQENHLSVRCDLQFNSSSRETHGEETSPVFPLINCSPGQSGSQQETRQPSSTFMTPTLDTPQQLSRSGELQRQLLGLQRQIATLKSQVHVHTPALLLWLCIWPHKVMLYIK